MISPQNLTARLKTSKSLAELRNHANVHSSMMDAVHDSTICVSCGRFGSSSKDDQFRFDCRDFYITAADMWLKRPEKSFGREARNVANILHAGAKLRVDPHHEVMKRLFDEALRMSEGFNSQGVANSIWAAATIGVVDPRVVNGLARACLDRVKEFNPQEASNSIGAIASLGVSDAHVIAALAQACADRVRDFNPQDAANSIWAIAKLCVSDAQIIATLAQACVDRVRDFNPQEASNSIWAIAKLGVSDAQIITTLAYACVDRVKNFNPQDASNSIWAIAKLGVSDAQIIKALAHACVDRVRDFNSQAASNSIWAIASLGVSDAKIIITLAKACVVRLRDFNPQEAANSIWAIATLGVCDDQIIGALAQACIDRVRDFNSQASANSIWAIASLGVSDERIITALAKACIDRIDKLNPQDVSNALWSAAVLNITDTDITRPLTSAVSERFMSITRTEHAQQCLQAHYSGLTLSDEAVKHFHAFLHAHPLPTSITNRQRSVSSALTRLGYSPQLEVPVFNGLVTTDIVVEKPSSDGSGRLIKVSIEFDGPTHYLRPALGSRDRVGPIDAKTRLRNSLLKKCNEFELLFTIPYFEWDEVQGKWGKEEEYIKRKMTGE